MPYAEKVPAHLLVAVLHNCGASMCAYECAADAAWRRTVCCDTAGSKIIFLCNVEPTLGKLRELLVDAFRPFFARQAPRESKQDLVGSSLLCFHALAWATLQTKAP